MAKEKTVYYPEEIQENPLPIQANVGTQEGFTGKSGDVYFPEVVPDSDVPNIPSKQVAREIIGTNLDTQARIIKGNFTFSSLGAIQIGKYVSGQSGQIVISPNGLVATNSSGVNTITIDGTTGDATFLGTVGAGAVIAASIAAANITGQVVNAQIASIEWAKITSVSVTNAQIASLDAGKITTGTLSANRIGASSITASKLNVSSLSAISADLGTVTAGSITGLTITGGTIRTASSGSRVEMSGSDNELRVYDGSTKIIQVDEGGMWIRTNNVIGLGGSTAAGQVAQIYWDNGDVGLAGLHINCSTSPIGIHIDDTVRINDCDRIDFDGSSSKRLYNNGSELESEDDFKVDGYCTIFGTLFMNDEDITDVDDLSVNDVKNFLIPHPDGSNRLLKYTSLEAPEVALQTRGVGTIPSAGVLKVSMPTHFTLVTEPDDLITVQLTAEGASPVFLTKSPTNAEIEIAGAVGTRVHWHVTAVRAGFSDNEVEIDLEQTYEDKRTQKYVTRELEKRDIKERHRQKHEARKAEQEQENRQRTNLDGNVNSEDSKYYVQRS